MLFVPSPGVKFVRSRPVRLEPDGRGPTWTTWDAWAARQRKPLAVDLFCGGGGLSLGLESAGFRVAFAADHDAWAVETHAANMQGLCDVVDLSNPTQEARVIKLLRREEISLIAGGPPCQPFSRAGRSAIRYLVQNGKRDAVDERRDLWQVWLRVVLAVRPRAVMLENVPDLALGDELRVVRRIMGALEDAGYETHIDVVEAPDLGVPQHRQRFILVALRDGEPFSWPSPQPRVSIWEAISDLPALGMGTGAEVLAYRKPKTPFQQRARLDVPEEDAKVIYDHVCRAVRDDDREAFRLMTSTTRYSDLPEHLRRYRADTFDDKYKRHGKDELARSITAHIAKDGYWYIHPTEERTLSVREAARLQTFPDWYRFAGNRTHAYRQIGNAVPPLLAERIGERILVALGWAKDRERQPVRLYHLPPTHIPKAPLAEARHRLDEWAAKDAVTAPWRHPGAKWPALLASVLMSSKADDLTIDYVLGRAPAPADLTEGLMARMDLTKGSRTALARLQPAVQAFCREPDLDGRWWSTVNLSPAERAWFGVLAFNDDALLTTRPPLRVAARVSGRPVDKIDRLTDGRMTLAALVGGGPKASARMAAVSVLARTVCTLKAPQCGSCPFADVCNWAAADLKSRAARGMN